MAAPITLCRDCARMFDAPPKRCPDCGGGRFFSHPELSALTIAHIDCDAFYASVEKRDNPAIAGRPVIVGGGRRGVVAACCYIARIKGVRSAMPMFKALAACPDAVVIRPDMDKYRLVGEQVRAIMLDLTPLVEPLSIDEAFLDLTGTAALHGGPPARTLARLVKRIEAEIGVTASIGLSFNKFLAKVASDLDKPRGLAAIGRAEAETFLEKKPVRIIWGVGQSLARRLEKDGVTTVGDLRGISERDLIARYGAMGSRLFHFARAEDDRRVTPGGEARSVSSETTFETDVGSPEYLMRVLWRMAEKVSARLKRKGIAGGGVVLKLKTNKFQILTRSRQLENPTQSAETIYRACLPLLEKEADGRLYRLLGAGVQNMTVHDPDGWGPDLLGDPGARGAKVEAAIDRVRGRFGEAAIKKGRSLKLD
ncbi:MAG: DNA polymerase IV [Rhodospirillaceae bacterium]